MKLIAAFLFMALVISSLADTNRNTVYDDDDEEDYTDTNPFIVPTDRPDEMDDNVGRQHNTERPHRRPNNGGNFYTGGGGSTWYSTNGGHGGHGGTSFHSTGSHFSSDGSNVFISSNKGPNGEDVVTISVTNPNVRIEGETCNYNELFHTCFGTNVNTFSSVTCNGLVCPTSTYQCTVTSEAIADDIKRMRTVSECTNKEGSVLERKEIKEPNPYPDSRPPYSRHAIVNRDGMVKTEDSHGRNYMSSNGNRKLTKEEQEELDRELAKYAEQMKKMQENFYIQQQAFQNQMQNFQANMQAQMQQAFGNGFPFGNNQQPVVNNRNNVPTNSANVNNAAFNPFANNFPFQYGFPGQPLPFNNFPFYSFPFFNPYGYNPQNQGHNPQNQGFNPENPTANQNEARSAQYHVHSPQTQTSHAHYHSYAPQLQD